MGGSERNVSERNAQDRPAKQDWNKNGVFCFVLALLYSRWTDLVTIRRPADGIHQQTWMRLVGRTSQRRPYCRHARSGHMPDDPGCHGNCLSNFLCLLARAWEPARACLSRQRPERDWLGLRLGVGLPASLWGKRRRVVAGPGFRYCAARAAGSARLALWTARVTRTACGSRALTPSQLVPPGPPAGPRHRDWYGTPSESESWTRSHNPTCRSSRRTSSTPNPKGLAKPEG